MRPRERAVDTKTLPGKEADHAHVTDRCSLDQRRAVLGVVHKLVSPYQAGIKWDPADHLCAPASCSPRAGRSALGDQG